VAAKASLYRATGEENEIREVFRRVLVAGIPLDEAELVHTDAPIPGARLGAIARAACRAFSGGGDLHAPRMAAIAFCDWAGQGFAAGLLRQAPPRER
jgi:hypothetical protein